MRFSVSPELGRIAMKEGLELAFVAWSVLHASVVAQNLSSHFTKKQAAKILGDYGLKFSQRHWSRIWEQGLGIFWGLNYNRLYLRSFKVMSKRLKALTENQDTSRLGAPIFVEIQLSGGMEDLRAQLYWAWFLQWEEKTISRDTLHDLFGLSHDQQRSYEALLGAKLLVKSNYAHINLETYKEQPRELPEHHFTIKYEREIRFDEDVDTVEAIQYQLPNSFLARAEAGNPFPVTDAPNRAKRAMRELNRHTESLLPQERTYWLKWSQFEVLGTMDGFIKTFYQGKKRLWLSGHYL